MSIEKTPGRCARIVESVIGLIEGGTLKTGERLPAIRRAAENHGVSKNTLADAYDRLVALGYLEARRGSGYYVRPIRLKPMAARPPHVAEALDLVSLLREQLEQHYAVRVGDGRPPPSWMEDSEVGRHLNAVGSRQGGEVSHGYGHPRGFRPLRERIALTLAERSITASPDQILLTQGANHALDLIVRNLVAPGDAVLVDSPGYYPLFGKLKLAKAEMVGIRRLADGPDLADLAAKAATTHAKVFFTQSLAHNPTGGSLTLPIAHRMLQIAQRHGLHIVEDDPFADVLPPSSPRLAALDQLERVTYVGTFSKTLSASLRVGYIAAGQPLADALADLKILTIVSTSDHIERIIHNLIVSGQYRRHLQRLRARIEESTVGALRQLDRLGVRIFGVPSGGFYLWALLPDTVDEADLTRRAVEHGIFMAPGAVFMPDRLAAGPAIRINVAYASDQRFLDFLKIYLAGK
ncbi:MAG TPA: PLP-dependent aminotransferase family protein [Aliidongia sp.]|uniref:aminotransferase-like domain-containing protein n=1 Tax=Aliidongia sp. TaxID=1914230 RepID=UPI002DDD5EF6|nr:PLP-dependent aminotransferase family protein [Aliidongia sp.]HEV2676034.1 PLP-dependent aminotransferase family protein [Aliidongia sp.]